RARHAGIASAGGNGAAERAGHVDRRRRAGGGRSRLHRLGTPRRAREGDILMWALLLGWWQNSYATVLKWTGIAAAALLVWFNIKESGRKDEQADELIAQNKNV